MVEEEEGSIDMAEVLEVKLNTFDIEKASKNEIASVAESLQTFSDKVNLFKLKQISCCFSFPLIFDIFASFNLFWRCSALKQTGHHDGVLILNSETFVRCS